MLRNLSLAFPLYLLSAQGAIVGDTDRFISLVQDGGGWSTQITIVNLSSKNATVLTSFILETAVGWVKPRAAGPWSPARLQSRWRPPALLTTLRYLRPCSGHG